MKKNKVFIITLILILLCLVASEKSFSKEEVFKYQSFGRRDPFVPLVGSHSVGYRSGAQNIHTIEDAKLEGVLTSPSGGKCVVINGEIFKEGDKAGELIVEEIRDDGVKVSISEVEYELKLYE